MPSISEPQRTDGQLLKTRSVVPFDRLRVLCARRGRVTIAELINDRCLVIGMPGAFTPADEEFLPSVKTYMPTLQSLVHKILIVLNTDPYVTQAWIKAMGLQRHVFAISDPNLSLTQSLGLAIDLSSFYLGERCRRGFFLFHRQKMIWSSKALELAPDAISVLKGIDWSIIEGELESGGGDALNKILLKGSRVAIETPSIKPPGSPTNAEFDSNENAATSRNESAVTTYNYETDESSDTTDPWDTPQFINRSYTAPDAKMLREIGERCENRPITDGEPNNIDWNETLAAPFIPHRLQRRLTDILPRVRAGTAFPALGSDRVDDSPRFVARKNAKMEESSLEEKVKCASLETETKTRSAGGSERSGFGAQPATVQMLTDSWAKSCIGGPFSAGGSLGSVFSVSTTLCKVKPSEFATASTKTNSKSKTQPVPKTGSRNGNNREPLATGKSIKSETSQYANSSATVTSTPVVMERTGDIKTSGTINSRGGFSWGHRRSQRIGIAVSMAACSDNLSGI